MILLILLSTIIAAISNAIMDKLAHHYKRSIFAKRKNQAWWDPNISWKNKYKNLDPKQGPKFWGATTIFVFTTDAWHFFKWILLGMLPVPGSLLVFVLFGQAWVALVLASVVPA